MEKIFVTGGSGYIGSFTIPYLIACGYEVTNYDKKERSDWDIENNSALLDAMHGHDAVIHLAAVPHPHIANEIQYRKMNWDAAVNVYKSAVQCGVKKFIFSSSGCAYGFWGGYYRPTRFPIREDDPVLSIEEGQNLYGYYKWLFEEYLRENAKKDEIKCISLRIEGLNKNIVGPYPSYLNKFLQDHSEEQKSCKLWHLLGNCTPENYQQLLLAALTTDLNSYSETFNVDNGELPPYLDPHKVISEWWPDAIDEVDGNGSLISVDKAKTMLGYRPVRPRGFDDQVESGLGQGVDRGLKSRIKRRLRKMLRF